MLTPRNDPVTFSLEFVTVLVFVILCMLAYVQAFKKHTSSNQILFFVIDYIFILFYIACFIIYLREYFLLLILALIYMIYSHAFKKQLNNLMVHNGTDEGPTMETSELKIKKIPIGFLIVRNILEQILLCVLFYGIAYFLQSPSIPLYICYAGMYILFYLIIFAKHRQISKEKEA